MTPKTSTPQSTKARAAAAADSAVRRRSLLRVGVGVAVVIAIGVLFVIFRSSTQDSQPGSADGSGGLGGSGDYVYQTGEPGVGEQAIDFSLTSTAGGDVSLADFAGKTVLTYWHEGLGCQPCWDQIRALEEDPSALEAAGIDELVAITSGPLDALQQKVSDEQLSTVTLADSDLAVSQQYQMNQFGMMGDSTNGHSFLLIGPDGKILWRADYGGSPNYTMFVPVDTLLEQLKAGMTS